MSKLSEAAPEEPPVLYEVTGPVARLTLNRPRYHNAQSAGLLDVLDAGFARAGADPDVRVIILAAAGKNFSSGHDLGSSAERNDPNSIFRQRGLNQLQLRSQQLFLETALRWRDIGKPTIAEVQGLCILGGYILAGAMDIIIASDDARFMPGLTQYFSLPWDINIRKAKEILFQSRYVDAEEALALGLVNEVVPRAALSERSNALAMKIGEGDPLQLRLIKQAINQAQDAMGFRTAIRDAHAHHMLSRVEAYLADDFGTGEGWLVGRNPAVASTLENENKQETKE